MIKGRHHWFLYPFFVWYGRFRMKQHFRKIIITGNVSETRLPVLLISNHFSWYDGFFAASLNKEVFHKKYHVMMLEDQLKKHWFFQHTGAFSVRKNSKSIVESLNYAVELLQNPENLVTYFPQGKFESPHQGKITFEKGAEWLLKNLRNKIQIIFVANQTEYFESARPFLFMHFQEYDYQGKYLPKIESDYNEFFHRAALRNIKLKDS